MKEYHQFERSKIVDYLKKCDRELLDTLASHLMESAKQAIKSRAKSNSKTKQKQTVKASR